jgi:hypothetical protein
MRVLILGRANVPAPFAAAILMPGVFKQLAVSLSHGATEKRVRAQQFFISMSLCLRKRKSEFKSANDTLDRRYSGPSPSSLITCLFATCSIHTFRLTRFHNSMSTTILLS